MDNDNSEDNSVYAGIKEGDSQLSSIKRTLDETDSSDGQKKAFSGEKANEKSSYPRLPDRITKPVNYQPITKPIHKINPSLSIEEEWKIIETPIAMTFLEEYKQYGGREQQKKGSIITNTQLRVFGEKLPRGHGHKGLICGKMSQLYDEIMGRVPRKKKTKNDENGMSHWRLGHPLEASKKVPHTVLILPQTMEIGVVGYGHYAVGVTIKLLSRGFHVAVSDQSLNESVLHEGQAYLPSNFHLVVYRSVQELSTHCQLIILAIPNYDNYMKAIEDEKEVLSSLKQNKIILDILAYDPKTSLNISTMCYERGCYYFDCCIYPQVGSALSLLKQNHYIYIGGNRSIMEGIINVIQQIGLTVYTGEVGTGVITKLIVNEYNVIHTELMNEFAKIASYFHTQYQYDSMNREMIGNEMNSSISTNNEYSMTFTSNNGIDHENANNDMQNTSLSSTNGAENNPATSTSTTNAIIPGFSIVDPYYLNQILYTSSSPYFDTQRSFEQFVKHNSKNLSKQDQEILSESSLQQTILSSITTKIQSDLPLINHFQSTYQDMLSTFLNSDLSVYRYLPKSVNSTSDPATASKSTTEMETQKSTTSNASTEKNLLINESLSTKYNSMKDPSKAMKNSISYYHSMNSQSYCNPSIYDNLYSSAASAATATSTTTNTMSKSIFPNDKCKIDDAPITSHSLLQPPFSSLQTSTPSTNQNH